METPIEFKIAHAVLELENWLFPSLLLLFCLDCLLNILIATHLRVAIIFHNSHSHPLHVSLHLADSIFLLLMVRDLTEAERAARPLIKQAALQVLGQRRCCRLLL